MRTPNIKAQNYMKLVINPFGNKNPLPSLVKTKRALKKINKRWYVHSGTALMLYRDNMFLPHDTDIDIAINMNWSDDNNERILEMIKVFESYKLLLVRSVIADNKASQLVFYDIENEYILIDIEFYFRGVVKDKLIHYKPEGTIILPEYQIKSLKHKDYSFPFPTPIESYLVDRYKDWKTPTGSKGAWQDDTPAFNEYE